MSRHDAKGRTRSKDLRHVRLYEWFVNTPAWRDLTPSERCVYIELEARYSGEGTNNGKIALSARQAAKACRVSKDTAAKAFASLDRHGFIRCETPGGFSTNSCLAPEWRLTRAPCDLTKIGATAEFKRWQLPSDEAERRALVAEKRAALAPKPSPKRGTVLSEIEDSRRAKVA